MVSTPPFYNGKQPRTKANLVQAFEGQTSIRCEPFDSNIMFGVGKLFPYFLPSLLFTFSSSVFFFFFWAFLHRVLLIVPLSLFFHPDLKKLECGGWATFVMKTQKHGQSSLSDFGIFFLFSFLQYRL